ncbi:hypothetical protein [Hydrogenimonas sp.]
MRGVIAVTLFLLVLGGCGTKRETSLPQDTARKFWSAMVQGDTIQAKALTVRGRLEEPLLKVKFLRAEVKGARVVDGRAFVPAVLFFANPVDRSAGECNATVETDLLNIEGRWLVDDVVTMENLDKALRKALAKCTSKAVEKAVEKGVESFESVKKELQKNFSDIAKELGETFQTIQKELKESLDRMQKELQKEPPRLPEPAEGDKI